MYALPPIYEPSKVEEEVARFWREHDIPRKFVEHNKGGPIFSFLEGPPTVNGYMHVGHVRGRVCKDVVLRFKTMQGFHVWRRAGWDCQGLPTELEVEKLLGIRSKKDVEVVGMERFVEEANKLVDHYIHHWRSDSERLGLWLDYDLAYETRNERYMEHVWYLLKKAHDDGDLVASYKVVPFCPRCETPLSSHEVSQGYEEVEDYSLYVLFPIVERTETYAVIWTTTPWTLLANEAIAVSGEESYVEVRTSRGNLIVAEKLLEQVRANAGLELVEIVKRLPGSELEGLRYRHPFMEEVRVHEQHSHPAHAIVSADFVSMEEGTGLVHIAPGHGPEDFELGKRYGLPVFCPIATNGLFTEEVGRFSGKDHREAANEIIDLLSSKGLLLHRGVVVHNYPHCWRCGTPLVYLASRQWFLRVDRIKRLMLEENGRIKWVPAWAGSARFREWLENAEDWCISRTKIWGTPLNVWTCESCGSRRVVGSRAETEREAIELPKELRLHRPWIDVVVFRCGKCGGMMKREPFVLDTWLDSGVAHFASIDYLSSPHLFNRLFPYDFITEAIDQTRGWFYTLLFTSALLFGRSPFKSVLTQSHVLDKEGKKMSKSKGNVIWANESFERFGVDNLRLYLLTKSQVWESMNFDPEEIKQVQSNLNVFWNVVSFAKTYFDLDRYDPEREGYDAYLRYAEPEDRWIVSRVNSLIRSVTASVERYELTDAARALLRFATDELSRRYVRAVRRRFWEESRSPKKIASYAAMYYVIMRYLVMLSTFAPYVAEFLYQRIRTKSMPESVCLLKWPKVEEEKVDQELEDAMEVVDDVIASSLNARQKAGYKLRWPVSRIVISPNSPRARDAILRLSDYLARMTNAMKVEVLNVSESLEESRRELEPVLSELGPAAGRRLNDVIAALRASRPQEVIDSLNSNGEYVLSLPDSTVFVLKAEHVQVVERLPDWFKSSEGRFATVYVDLKADETLKSMAFANEVIRRVQVMRKEMNLELTEVVDCGVYVSEHLKLDGLRALVEHVEEETRTRLDLMSSPPTGEEFERVGEWQIDDVKLVVGLMRRKKVGSS
ncbi:MAG: isoleucine--tRNA ligase [Thaumarchaeota archaeon]|nr:isoleucine--tRNA ligase [Candidatus Calditenuaceae archaeon]MDW8186497.1 isoleucine--tRNA ligase [Nitrososphaerota archaeon]